MKTTRRTIAWVGLAWLVTAFGFPIALAADTNAPMPSHEATRKPSPQELQQQERNRQQFEKFEAQAKAAAEARRLQNAARLTSMVPASLVKQYDANGNGLIDPSEWRKYRADVDKRTAELLQSKPGR